MLRRAPAAKSSVYADEGTFAHEFAESFLRGDRRGSPVNYVGDSVRNSSGREIPLDADFCAAVQLYVDYCRALLAVADWDAVESAITLESISPPAPMHGTADFLALVGSTLHVVDLKFGRGVLIEAVDNLQALYYAIGAYLSLDPSMAGNVREVSATIVQPRAEHPEGCVRRWAIPVEELLDRVLSLFDAALRALAPGAPLEAGEHCRFCAAHPICPEASKNALAVARKQFGVIDADTPPARRLVSLEEIGELLGKFEGIENWMAAVRAYAQQSAESGQTLPGWKLVAKRATRQWISVDQIEKWGEDNGVYMYSPRELLSPAQLEKALGKENMHMFPAELVRRHSSGFTLAPEGDSRPAVHATSATAEFSVIE